MLLQRSAARFCRTPLYYADLSGNWTLAEVMGRMPPYDRFISDRAFGQKKRLLQTPGGEFLPEAKYIRVGAPEGRTYIVESVNEDQDEHGPYLNIYMLRETTVEITIVVQEKVKLASGATSTEWVDLRSIYGDFDRYGVLRSSELPVDYSSYTAVILETEEIPTDCRLRIDGKLYAVTEDFMQLELRQLRLRDA